MSHANTHTDNFRNNEEIQILFYMTHMDNNVTNITYFNCIFVLVKLMHIFPTVFSKFYKIFLFAHEISRVTYTKQSLF